MSAPLRSGVEYLHRMRVVHRDLKLENALVDLSGPSPQLKICDFGYSKSGLDSQPKTRIGTPAYIAPEVYQVGGAPVQMWKAVDPVVQFNAMSCFDWRLLLGTQSVFSRRLAGDEMNRVLCRFVFSLAPLRPGDQTVRWQGVGRVGVRRGALCDARRAVPIPGSRATYEQSRDNVAGSRHEV